MNLKPNYIDEEIKKLFQVKEFDQIKNNPI